MRKWSQILINKERLSSRAVTTVHRCQVATTSAQIYSSARSHTHFADCNEDYNQLITLATLILRIFMATSFVPRSVLSRSIKCLQLSLIREQVLITTLLPRFTSETRVCVQFTMNNISVLL